MSRDFWIADLRISDAMEAKIRDKHRLTGEQVRSACVPDAYDRAGWEAHPAHGLRLLVEGVTWDDVAIKVILQPVDVREGVWRLRTAMRRMKS
jgi:hypothetical protein